MDLASEIITGGTRNVAFPVEGRPDCPGYLSKGDSEQKIGIVLLQEWWGLNQSLCITADKFASKGFVVLVPDVYRGESAKNREEAGHFFKDLDWKGAVADMKAASLYLQNVVGCKKVGVTGFCMGGALSYAVLSAENVFQAGAPFYGVCDLEKFPLKNITAPIQAHFGEHDASVGFSDVLTANKVDKAAKDLNLDYQTIIWPDCKHAFMNQNSVNYNAESAQKALEEVSAFFKKRLSQ